MIARIGEYDRVRARTAPEILAEIDGAINQSVRNFATQSRDAISARIGELENEWDIERWLQTHASAIALTGLILGVARGKRWFLLTGGALGFLLQHAAQGWCPPLTLLRRMGVRTRSEIEREKYALKILRGDFENISDKAPGNQVVRAHDALRAVSA
jgi:hypothetical protein